MRELHVFNQVSLDGYFCDSHGDMSWAHRDDPEWRAFTNANARGDADMLFGRVTYDMMSSFWPTPAAAVTLPDVARRMNGATKYVVSRSLARPAWENTTVLSGELVEDVQALKAGEGPDILIMGSGSIVAQLTAARLIDEYQVVAVPVVLGSGRSMFSGVAGPLALELRESRRFSNGNVVLWYTRGS